MKLSFDKEHFKCFCVYFIISVLCVLFLELTPFALFIELDGLTAIVIVVLVESLLFLFINTKISSARLTFSSIFFGLVCLFNFGQVFIYVLGMTSEKSLSGQHLYLYYFSEANNFYAFRYISYAYISMMIGCLFLEMVKWSETKIKTLKIPIKTLQNRAKILLLLTLPIKISVDLMKLFFELTMGHSVGMRYFESRIPSFINGYGLLSMIGLGVLVTTLGNDVKKQRTIVVLAVSYFIIMMLGGSRGVHMCCLCIIIFLYVKSKRKKADFQSIVLSFVGGYCLLSLLYAIAMSRAKMRSLIDIVSSYLDVLIYNEAFIRQLIVFGYTGYTAECVLIYWLPNLPIGFGSTYVLGAIDAILLRTGSMGDFYNKDVIYGRLLQDNFMVDPRYFNIGGSLIGEAFYNFGDIGGVLFCCLVGVIIGYISKKCDVYLSGKIDYRIGYYIIIMINLLFYIRGYFPRVARFAFFSCIFWFLIMNISIRRTRKGMRSE